MTPTARKTASAPFRGLLRSHPIPSNLHLRNRYLSTTASITMSHAQRASKSAKTSLRGAELLDDPVWNKGSAFSRSERSSFGINGYLPYAVHTLEEQVARAWQQYQSKPDNLAKNTFLTSLRDQNQILYFALLGAHVEEVMPVVYTPTEGDAIANYSRLFRRPEGLFLAFPNADTMEEDLLTYVHEEGRKAEDIDLIVVSDGEQILGIGDQGVGGVSISTAKAAIYTLIAGVDPSRTISVGLDVGTENPDLLKDELYVGWRHNRVRGEEYDSFVDKFTNLVKEKFPNALLHFEDFGLNNALRLLEKYRPKQSVFNDDIQGTAAVALAAIFAACKITKTELTDHRFVIHGAGTAGVGIAGQIRSAIEKLSNGMSAKESASLFWLVDKDGLIHDGLSSVRDSQKPYSRSSSEISKWDIGTSSGGEAKDKKIGLLEVVKNVKPTVLIGVSTQHNAFTEEIVKSMAGNTESPLILPLSNPTKLAECDPKDAYAWSDGKAILATGSPFPAVEKKGSKDKYKVAECNNALAYPGLALGVIVSKASRLSDAMIVSGIDAIAELSPAVLTGDSSKAILPSFSKDVSVKVATAVAMKAVEEDVAREESLRGKKEKEVEDLVKSKMWEPVYKELEYEPPSK